MQVVDSPAKQVFLSDIVAWSRSGDEASRLRAMRSSFSGVPHDIAAAYAIARERLAVGTEEREAVFRFNERMQSLRSFADEATDDELCARACEIFALDEISTIDNLLAGAESSDEFALAEAQDAERGSGVRARQTHFSASALNAYAECARKWYYRYVCAAVEDPGSSASTYGTALHAALEDFHEEFPRPNASQEAAMRNKIEGYVNWAFERFRADFDTVVEVELHKRRAVRTAQRYIDWLLAEARRAPFTVIGRELPVNLDLDGFAFVGFIDRLDRDDRTGAVSIFDYKTGSIATSAFEYREKVRKFCDFQLPFYYWAQTAQGDRVSRLALIPLKDALHDVQPIALEIVTVPGPEPRRNDSPTGTIAISDLERARARMIEICRDLTSGDLKRFPVTDDPSACRYCAYVTACADHPHAERERFGR
jgi:RecB family exonuclease